MRVLSFQGFGVIGNWYSKQCYNYSGTGVARSYKRYIASVFRRLCKCVVTSYMLCTCIGQQSLKTKATIQLDFYYEHQCVD